MPDTVNTVSGIKQEIKARGLVEWLGALRSNIALLRKTVRRRKHRAEEAFVLEELGKFE